tara:strand:- start:382 stop:510 length:129 start_codon:yes stop_codon:yes gene_type:complete
MIAMFIMFAAAGFLVACSYKRNVYDPQTRAAERYGVDLDRRR